MSHLIQEIFSSLNWTSDVCLFFFEDRSSHQVRWFALDTWRRNLAHCLPITRRFTTVLIERARLKSTRQRYSPSSEPRTGSNCSWATDDDEDPWLFDPACCTVVSTSCIDSIGVEGGSRWSKPSIDEVEVDDVQPKVKTARSLSISREDCRADWRSPPVSRASIVNSGAGISSLYQSTRAISSSPSLPLLRHSGPGVTVHGKDTDPPSMAVKTIDAGKPAQYLEHEPEVLL